MVRAVRPRGLAVHGPRHHLHSGSGGHRGLGDLRASVRLQRYLAATTIITFLMVFVIQNTQNRDTAAMHIKID